MKIWIDCSNSPHPLLFAPVARRLQNEGHAVMVTARDNAQTVELTRERWPGAEVIGAPSPRGRCAKVATLGRRVTDLRRWARRVGPDVALSHNSYAQIVAARSLGIPAVTAMDFEHQPANHLAFRLATTVLVPEVLPQDAIERQGAAGTKVVRYPGSRSRSTSVISSPTRRSCASSASIRGRVSWPWPARLRHAPSITPRRTRCSKRPFARSARRMVSCASSSRATQTRSRASNVSSWTIASSLARRSILDRSCTRPM